jgi:hypothetical protein
VDLIKKILLESFKNDPHVNGLLEKSKNKFKLNVLIDYVAHQTLRKGETYLSDDHNGVALWDLSEMKRSNVRTPYGTPINRSDYTLHFSALR